MQLRGGKRGSLRSDRFAAGICRPRLKVTLVILGWPRLRQRTRRARLRHRDVVTRLSKRPGGKRLVAPLTVWVGVFGTLGDGQSLMADVSPPSVSVSTRKQKQINNRNQEIQSFKRVSLAHGGQSERAAVRLTTPNCFRCKT